LDSSDGLPDQNPLGGFESGHKESCQESPGKEETGSQEKDREEGVLLQVIAGGK